MVQERAAEITRLPNVLEAAHLKLAAVAAAILGKSGRALLAALVQGQADPQRRSSLLRGRLRATIPQGQHALQGRVQAQHRFLSSQSCSHLECLAHALATGSRKVQECLAPFAEAVVLLQTIPAVHASAAARSVAEIGPALSRGPRAKQ